MNSVQRFQRIFEGFLPYIFALGPSRSCDLDIPEENLAKSESSMLPESKMDFDYTIDYRKH